MDDLIGEFIEETAQSLATLTRELTADHIAHDTWQSAYKLVHTIKGTCGFLGLKRLEIVASGTEGLLAKIQAGKVTPVGEIIAAVHEAVLRLNTIVSYLSQFGSEPVGDDRTLLTRLEQAEKAPPPAPSPAPAVAEIKPAPAPIQEATKPTPPPRMDFAPPPSGNLLIASNEAPPITPSPEPASGELLGTTLNGMVHVRNQLRSIAAAISEPKLESPIGKLSNLVRRLRRSHAGNVAQIMVVEANGQNFGLLQSETSEVLKLQATSFHDADMPLLRYGGSWLPIKSMRALLKLKRPSARAERYGIVLRSGDQQFALAVEQLGRLEEVVIGKLPTLLGDMKLYHGTCLLGDGSVCLIMSAAGIMEGEGRITSPLPVAPEIEPWIEPAKAAPLPQVEEDIPPAPSPEPVTAQPIVAPPPPPPPPPKPQPVSYLLFDAGDGAQKAVPLSEVKRVDYLRGEDVARGPEPKAPCRGEEIRLLTLPGAKVPETGFFQIVLLNSMPGTALVTHATFGIVQQPVAPILEPAAPPYAGRTNLDGKKTDVVDVTRLPAHQKEAA